MLTRWIEKLVPRLLWRHRANSWGFSEDDAEFSILPDFVERRKLSLDVGGAGGTYTAMLIPLSKRVVVFEPIPSVASKLRTLFAGTSLVSVEQVALSDTSGVVTMRVPTDLYWRGTIEPGNRLRHSAAVDEITVTRRTIDEYALDNVGFVKIDVEGHELAVLNGSINTIRRERPTFLVEVEEQHRSGALADVFGFFKREGYCGLFVQNGRRQPLSSFDASVHQNLKNLDHSGKKRGLYINNFAFYPAERASQYFR